MRLVTSCSEMAQPWLSRQIIAPIRHQGLIRFSLIMLLLCANAMGMAQNPVVHNMASEDAFGDGVKNLLIERYDNALASFTRASELEPNNAAIRFKIAEVLVKTNKLPEAEVHARKALELDDNNPYYYDMLASILKRTNKPKEAIKILKLQLKKFPKETDNYYALAEAYFNEQDYEESIKVLAQMEKQFGVNPDLTRQKQQILLSINKLGDAIKEGENLINQSPDDPIHKLSLAELLMNNNQDDKALKWINTVKQNHPENGYASLLLYQIYRKSKKPEADQELTKALSNPEVNLDDKIMLLRPWLANNADSTVLLSGIKHANEIVSVHGTESRAFALLGDFYNLADKKQEARKAYITSTLLPGTTMPVWQEVIRLDAELGQSDSVYKHASLATELYPNQPLFWFYKGRSAFIKMKYAECGEAMEQANRLANGNNALIIDANALAGDAYYYVKDYEKSDEAFEKVLALDPENEHVLNNYSYFLSVRKSKLGKAREMAEKLHKKRPDDATYVDTYAWVLFQLKLYKEALPLMEKAVQQTTSGVIVEHYGDILSKLGRTDEAIAQWKKAKSLGGELSPAIDKKISTRTYVE